MSRLAGPVAKTAGVAILACAVALVAVGGTARAGEGEGGERAPNVIMIVTDDQAAATYSRAYMPRVFGKLVAEGTTFEQSIVATPLCCPSRAALQTGQYGHNNGVLRNNYDLLDRKRNVLSGWLRRAGYRTIHVGRFYNGYENGGRADTVAPGWDVWRTTLYPRRYYDYEMRINDGRVRHYGTEDRDHLTAVLNRISTKVIEREARRKAPFYLQLDHFAPHDGRGSRDGRCDQAAVPAPADEAAYPSEPLPAGPAFDEADISDKPSFIRAGLEPVSDSQRGFLERRWRCGLASLRAVDRGVGKIWRTLREQRLRRDTVVVFTSDNGYAYGEHRIVLDKHYPYEEALRVPLTVRLPSRLAPDGQPRISGAPVANVDLAPTVLELAGAEPCKRGGCRVLDGRSLLGEASGSPDIPRDRAITLGFSAAEPNKGLVCEYQGLRTTTTTYVSHLRARRSLAASCDQPAAEREHYDRVADPFQLANLFPAPVGTARAAEQAGLAARLQRLRNCRGIEGRDPAPAGRSFCE